MGLTKQEAQKRGVPGMLHFSLSNRMVHDSISADVPQQVPQKSKTAKEIHQDALLEYAHEERAFTLQEVTTTHPSTNLYKLFETARVLTKSGVLHRVAKGIYISARRGRPSEDEAQALKEEAEKFECLSEPLLQHLASPKMATELCALMGMTAGSVSLRADRLQKAGLVQRRVIDGRLYFARSEDDLDRLASDDANRINPVFLRILDYLPEDGLVERSALLGKKGVGPIVGARQLDKLQSKGLVGTCSFSRKISRKIYVFLTEEGKSHPNRSQDALRLPAADWSQESHVKRLGVIMALDLLQPLCLREIKAATLSLPAPFSGDENGKHVAATVNRMLREGVLDWADANQDPHDPFALIVLTKKAEDMVSVLRRFSPYPDQRQQEAMRKTVEEKRRRRQVQQKRLHSRTTPLQFAVLDLIKTAQQEWLTEAQIQERVSTSMKDFDLRRTLAALCERKMLERSTDPSGQRRFSWRITQMGRNARN